MVFQILGVIAAVWLVLATWQIWLLFFTALIIAAAILPAARWGELRHIPRGVTVLLVYVGVIALFTLLGRLVWPALSEQWRQFTEQLPRLVENARAWLGNIDYWLAQWGASLPQPKADNVGGLAGSLAGTILPNVVRVTTGAVGAVVEVLAMLVVAAYLVIDARDIGHTLVTLLPREHRPTASRLAPLVLDRIGGYVRGQLVSSFFVGVLIAVALSLLGVKYALLIGFVAAALNFVPFVTFVVKIKFRFWLRLQRVRRFVVRWSFLVGVLPFRSLSLLYCSAVRLSGGRTNRASVCFTTTASMPLSPKPSLKATVIGL